MSKEFWGSDTTSEVKPQWPRVRRPARVDGLANNQDLSANTYATEMGWTKKWPWGEEVIVALRGLATKLGIANVDAAIVWTLAGTAGDGSGLLVNAAGQSLTLVVTFNEPVEVTGVPTLDLTATGSGRANVTLSYNAALSAANTLGKLVFENTDISLAHANYANSNLVVNSSSVVSGWDGIVDLLDSNAVANGIPTATSIVLPVYQEKPVHTGTLRVGTAANTTNQTIGFELRYNQACVVTGTPSIKIIGDANSNPIGNTPTLYFRSTHASTNVAGGNLVFTTNSADFSALVNAAIFTLNSSANLTGFSGIKNAIGGTVVNGILVANTFTVTVA